MNVILDAQPQGRARTWSANLALYALIAGAFSPGSAWATFDYASHLGGLEDDLIASVTVAPNGDRVFCGNAESSDLATPGAFQSAPAGKSDLIVGRYAAEDKSLVWLSYFGGAGVEQCGAIALDSAGNIVFAGRTASPDFPTLNADDATYAGGGSTIPTFEGDAFVAKITGDGTSVLFSTFLGGVDQDISDPRRHAGREIVRSIAIDDNDRIVVVGDTSAPDFPATRVLGDGECGLDGFADVPALFVGDQFVVRYQPDGSQDFAVCISGDNRETSREVIVDEEGLLYVIGATASTNYPTTLPGIGTANADIRALDAVVTVLDAEATQILRSVQVGGSQSDGVSNAAFNDQGQLVVQGISNSLDFPTTANAWQTESGQSVFESRTFDVVVFSLSPELDELLFSTYVGGPESEEGASMALDGDQPVLQMTTSSPDLPTINAIQSEKSADMNGFYPFASTGAIAFEPYRNFATSTLSYGFVAAGPGATTVYTYTNAVQDFALSVTLPGVSDPRDLDVGDINSDGLDDIVVGNYEAQNVLYLGTSSGQFSPPIVFGDPQTKTTGIALPEPGCIVEFVEEAANFAHRYTGEFDNPLPFNGLATASRDVANATENNDAYTAEISAPDEVTLYRGCFESGVNPVADVMTFPGGDLIDVVVGFIGDDSEFDLAIADRNGGVKVVMNALPDGLSSSVITFDTPPLNALEIVDGSGIVTAHDNSYRYYRLSSPTTFELDTEQIVSTSADVIYYDRLFSDGDIYAGVNGEIARGQVVANADDLYFIRLNADLSDATYATYFGGPGEEFTSFGVAVAASDQYVFSGSTRSAGFPVSGDAQQPVNAGKRDAVFIELDVGAGDIDTDGDGVLDADDNCTLAPNFDQIDSDADGFGNACDGDLNNDNIVNFGDLGIFRVAFFGNPGADNWNPDADFNGDGNVGFIDLGLLRTFFFAPPGPAGVID